MRLQMAICLDLSKGKIEFLRKHSGQFGNVVHFVASYHPLNYYFIKGERLRKIKMKNREILINPGKKNNNNNKEREVVAGH